MTTENLNNETLKEEEQKKAIAVWFQHVQGVLQEQFTDYRVEGGVGSHPDFGPVFAFKLIQGEIFYSCGFLLSEVLEQFRSNEAPGVWLASFYIDMIREGKSTPFPASPTNDQEYKDLVDTVIVPYCVQAVKAEFIEDQVVVDLSAHPERGLVVEAGFPAIKEGSNTAAIPLPYMVALYLMNRDPSEPLLTGLYQLYDQHFRKN